MVAPMLELSVDNEVPKTLFYDEIINLNVAYTHEVEAKVTVQANAHGQSLDGTSVVVPIYECEYSMKNETKTVEIHLHFVNQSLSELNVEFTAVAVVPEPSKKQHQQQHKHNLSTSSSIQELSFDIEVLELVKSSPQKLDATHLGHEAARAVIKAKLVPCLDISLNYVRPGFGKDSVLCQFDFATFSEPVHLSDVQFSAQQGTATPLVPIRTPLCIESSSVWAFALRMDTLLARSVCKVQVDTKYVCAGRNIKSQWASRINLAEAAGPAPRTPLVPPAGAPASKRNSTISTHSVPSVSSQTAIYPAPLTSVTSSGPVRTALSGVSIYITGPDKVKLGDEFEWKVMLVNKTSRARKLALFLYAKESTSQVLTRHEERALVSDAFTLLKRVQVYRAAIGKSMGIIPLVPSLRVGQLGPYSCFEATVRLLAAEPGLHSVSGSTVQDFSSGEIYETGELLQVLVES